MWPALKKRIGSFATLHHHRLASPLPSLHVPYKVDGSWMYIDVSESPMMMARLFGLYEPNKREAMQAFLHEGSTFVDIGANKGDFSLLAARLVGDAGRVLAFEPEPANQAWIQKSIAANRYSNVHLFPVALGDVEGTTDLHIGEKSGWHSIMPSAATSNRRSISVRVRPLDRVLAEACPELDVDVIKVDVEGAELAVLRGAAQTLQRADDLVLLLDIHPQLGVNQNEIFDLLAEFGFEMFDETPPFKTPIARDAPPDTVVAYKARRA